MRFNSRPEASVEENSERHPSKSAAEAAVAEKVAELDCGLNLEQRPELRSRLAEIGRHFEDSLDMAKIIRALYGRFQEALGLDDAGPERLARVAVVHDIGKSGPPGEETAFNDAVQRLFDTGRPFDGFADGRPKMISDYVREQEIADGEKIMAAIEASGVEPEKESMIDFWRRHANWTYGILLRLNSGSDIDPDIIKIAASHHLLESQNPAGLDLNGNPAEAQVLKKTLLLAAVDKYQAFRSRLGLGHEDAMARLGKITESRPDLPEPMREIFRAVVGVLADSEGDLAQFFMKKDGE